MAELSSHALSVMVAATNGNTNVVNDPVYKQCIAAALRAAVSNVDAPLSIIHIPEQQQRWYGLGVANLKRKLLTIAAELEGGTRNPLEPNDLSHLSDEEFHALAPQGFHGV